MDLSLPPVSKYGVEMLQARINYEQAMEGLRLNYVAARRLERQAARAEAAARRQELQSRSKQPLISLRSMSRMSSIAGGGGSSFRGLGSSSRDGLGDLFGSPAF